jgi:hypothetical protein
MRPVTSLNLKTERKRLKNVEEYCSWQKKRLNICHTSADDELQGLRCNQRIIQDFFYGICFGLCEVADL